MTSRSVLDLVKELSATLERVGDALVRLDAATLLSTGEALGEALEALASIRVIEGREREAIKADIERIQVALPRCRRLGASFSGVARVRLQMCAGTQTYDCHGAVRPRAVRGSAVKAMV